MFNIKKITTTPRGKWEAMSALVKREQELIAALHILQSVIDNQDDGYKEIHHKRIEKFLSNYQAAD